MFALGVYAWAPPYFRHNYFYMPRRMMNINVSGMCFSGFIGLCLGTGAGFLLCDVKKPRYYERVRQTVIGTAAFIVGVFALSPGVLKARWLYGMDRE
jgi:hypothetical protein